MGLARRKVSGRTIGGSRLVVDGQPIFSVVKYVPHIRKQTKKDFFVEGAEKATTTTTDTQIIETCKIYNNIT